MRKQLEDIRQKALESFENAKDTAELDAMRVKVLGKKGELTAVLKQMGKLAAEERPVMGQLANECRTAIEEALERCRTKLEAAALNARLEAEAVDVTIPGTEVKEGHRHPISFTMDEVRDTFSAMGYEVIDGPEIELADYVFTKLNTPKTHPARDRSDTFYTQEDEEVLLRTQTSPMQIRVMEQRQPPIRIISPGRVFRKDEVDATHSPMFHQIEGLVVDEGITFGDLKGALTQMIQELYGQEVQVRFRPHHFPYTEPSCEVDVQCFECGGKGCRVCKGEGWIELLGSGMVHPKVLETCGIDSTKYSGFAFGVGGERLAMRRFAINDMRLLYENDQRFLEQF